MEVTIASALSAIIAYLGSGWIGIVSSVLVLVLFLVVWASFKSVAAKYAYRESKEQEIGDQISNRNDSAKLEQGWSKFRAKIDQLRSKSEKKKRN